MIWAAMSASRSRFRLSSTRARTVSAPVTTMSYSRSLTAQAIRSTARSSPSLASVRSASSSRWTSARSISSPGWPLSIMTMKGERFGAMAYSGHWPTSIFFSCSVSRSSSGRAKTGMPLVPARPSPWMSLRWQATQVSLKGLTSM